MAKVLLLAALLALIVCALGQNDPYCSALVDCLKDVEQARTQCDQQRNAALGKQKGASSSDDCSKLVAKSEELQQLITQFQQDRIKCISSGLSKQGQCQAALTNVRQGANAAAKATTGRQTRRQKRQKKHGVAARVHSNASLDANASRSGGPPAGSHGGSNATAGKAARVAAAGQFRQCYENVRAKQSLCTPLNQCCSLMIPCDIQFHLSSPIHSKYYQVQLDVYNLRESCGSKKGKGGQRQKTGKTNTNAAAGSAKTDKSGNQKGK